jgi:SAM-dependent methyltransferase
MLNVEEAREQCWEIFKREYPGYVNEDELYLRKIRALLPPRAHVLDAGCGWELPFARQIAGQAEEVIGVDLGITYQSELANVKAIEADLERLPFPDARFDLVMSRSVLEHLERPRPVFEEIARVLKPGGKFVFLIPNAWDYVSVISWMVPNRLHGAIVEKIQGRDQRDTFPAFYRANSLPTLRQLCRRSGMRLVEGELLSQYPAYLMFSPTVFRAGIFYEKMLRRFDRLAWLRSWILGVAERTI